MFAHTFRGSTWRSALGLESARAAFSRYRMLRQRERVYLDWPDPHPPSSGLDVHIRGASPLGLPDTLSRAPLRRRASTSAEAPVDKPVAWLARDVTGS
jgi:hypothetical protein